MYERLKPPLLTLMVIDESSIFLRVKHVILFIYFCINPLPQAGGSNEIVHCILAHLGVIIPRCPGLYDEDFRSFYVRDYEPHNIKHAKVGVPSIYLMTLYVRTIHFADQSTDG